MKRLTVYSRDGRHLCEEAMSLLRRLQPEFLFELEEVDIEQDDKLLKLYQWRIPVVTLDGREIAAAPINFSDLRRALAPQQ
ncbi:MAG TPA: glutaredoxin family protein [Dehalococcoidia bacterium]|nr:glutaredoxin family protein [Dehalococcoidia bacterium]